MKFTLSVLLIIARSVMSVTVNLGTPSVTLNIFAGAARALSAQEVTGSPYSLISVESLTFSYDGVETFFFPLALYESQTEADLKTAMKEARGCTFAGCSLVFTDIPARRVLTAGDITATLTFTGLSEANYNTMSSSGGDEFDSAAFKTALATDLSVDESSFTITSDGGSVTVHALFSIDPVVNVPLDATFITHMNSVQTLMDTTASTSTLANGALTDTVTTIVLDLCTHNCQTQGTCNSATGICTCIGNYWGIDCETACTCANGEPCVNQLCQCEYPQFGLRCDSNKTCGCEV
jgi:hypothetical protein